MSALSACGDEAKNAYEDGVAALNNADYAQAVSLLAKATSIEKEQADYFLAYGNALVENKQYDDAVAAYQKVMLSKDNKIVRENNKKALRGMGMAYFFQKDYANAINMLTGAYEIKELSELNNDIYYYVALAKEYSGDDQGAKELYTKLISAGANNDIYYVKRGMLSLEDNDAENAKADFHMAIEINDRNIEAYIGQYRAELLAGNEQTAEQVLVKATAISADTEEDKYQQGKVYFYLGRYGEAKARMDEAVKANISMAYSYLGQIYMAQEDYEEALKQFGNYEKFCKEGETPYVDNQIALCYIKTEQYDKAMEYINQGLSYGEYTQAYQSLKFNEVVVNEELGNFKKAKKLAKKYISQYPKDQAMKKEYKFLKRLS